jgi:YHS domain-containing protein
MKKKILKRTGIILLVLIGIVFVFVKVKRITPLAWGHKAVNTPMFGNEAINGYDPVAYFTKEQAVKGEKTFGQNWKGANWYFSSAKNLNLFKTNPEKYAPQFGGYCAFAVSKGFTANTDPKAFKIINDKLYLCADKKILEQWLVEKESLKKSEENWK